MVAVIIALLIIILFLGCYDMPPYIQSIKDKLLSTSSSGGSESDVVMVEDNTEEIKGDSFMNDRRAPNTWEPSTVDYEKLDNDTEYKSYAEDLNANVDGAIIESHREYTEDTDFLATTGASHASARDDFMPAVKHWGLPRSAHYAQIGAESSSRVVQSETSADIQDVKEHHATEYRL
jgi:hypothetical protein